MFGQAEQLGDDGISSAHQANDGLACYVGLHQKIFLMHGKAALYPTNGPTNCEIFVRGGMRNGETHKSKQININRTIDILK